ncbi:hypothetical protein [Methanobrevibacter sp.]|uniref:hypothetical protein n=1 Tax=Methanobrevibacter sp. TaxID=66852 RepID=UPI00388E3981
MELVKVENGSIVVAEDVLEKFHEFQVVKARMEMEEKKVKEALLMAMEENGIKSFENDFVKITYKAPTTRKSIDSNALKEQGLYDAFVKETPVKSSVVLTWK